MHGRLAFSACAVDIDYFGIGLVFDSIDWTEEAPAGVAGDGCGSAAPSAVPVVPLPSQRELDEQSPDGSASVCHAMMRMYVIMSLSRT